jgi:hypothetical protein
MDRHLSAWTADLVKAGLIGFYPGSWGIRSPGNWFRLEPIDLEFVVAAMDALA